MIVAGNSTSISSEAFLTTKTRSFNLWWQATFFMLSLLAITLLLHGIDDRQLDSISVWTKPLKFESSLVMYFITLTLLAGYLPEKIRHKASWRMATYIAVGSGLFEVIYILLQAARGRASHYNKDTVIESVMYGLMGVGAVALVAVSFYLGWLLYRHHLKNKDDSFILASAYGLMLGSILTLITAGVMSSGQTHFAGTPAIDGLRVPVVGWLLSGGDLRIPHFFATHLMQFLPLYGFWLQRREVVTVIARKKIMVFSMTYCAALLVLFAVSYIY